MRLDIFKFRRDICVNARPNSMQRWFDKDLRVNDSAWNTGKTRKMKPGAPRTTRSLRPEVARRGARF
ncbi:hypothetical protein CR51_22805 [Caballeronia megalochromosomata]|nr:hypothetical protein CR51_22805 [Caballeronia megalochromosomata]